MAPKKLRWLISGAAATTVAVVVVVVLVLNGGGSAPSAAPMALEATTPPPELVLSPPPSPSPAPSPSASPSPSPVRTSAAPKPRTSAPKPAVVKPSYQPPPQPVVLPPAPPAHTPNSDCRTHEAGQSDASHAAVRAALTKAANVEYWQSAPITVPVNLILAIAYQESGWQSTIIACDGGIGTMQLMPGTVTFVNGRFLGPAQDPHTLAGNTTLGAEYLEWLIKYFGDVWFDHHYELSTEAGKDGLLNAVIAAYNVGPHALEDEANNKLVIPNQRYLDNVRALMTECKCLDPAF